MSPKTDLIARLEAEAIKADASSAYYKRSSEFYTHESQSAVFQRFATAAREHSQHAADLRAAAVAVRLVGECREALAAIRNEVSAGCHSDAPVEELKTGIHYEPVLVVDTVIEKIAEWEGKHV